jgi:hypothetical protein
VVDQCAGIASSVFSRGRQRPKPTMKRHLLRGARIARLSCLAFVLLGFSQMVKAQPIVINSNFSLAVFAKAPTGLTNPDSITTDAQGTIFVAYANATQPDGTGGDSTIVRFSSTGSVLKTYQVVGKSDGMKFNPSDGKIWCLRNEDSNPAVTLIDPATGVETDLEYAAPPVHGGGYDDVVFTKGQIFISASNPNTQPPTPQTPNGQNTFPSIVKATIVGNKISVSPVLMGNATLIDIAVNAQQRIAQQSDPDSLKTDQSGNLVLDSQADGELIFLTNPGTPNQLGRVLHLLTGSSTQVTVDDTVFPTQPSGTIYVVDTGANVVYAVASHAFTPNSAFAASDNTGVLAQVDLTTGNLSSIVTGMKSPHGALFVPSLPLGF